jgi:hypothetical protein
MLSGYLFVFAQSKFWDGQNIFTKNQKYKKSIFSSEQESKIFFFLIMNSKSLK